MVNTTSLLSLPDELLLIIFGDPQLTEKDLRSLRKCSVRLAAVSNTLLFESVVIKIPIHHGGSCSRATQKHTSNRSEISSYPEITLTRTKYLKIQFENFCCGGCSYDQRVCRKIFKSHLLGRPKDLKQLDITVDWWSAAAIPVICLIHEGLRNVSDGTINLEWKNLNIPKMDAKFISILTRLPHHTLKSFKISFYGGNQRFSSNLNHVHKAMGQFLISAKNLQHLSLFHVSSPGNIAHLEINEILSVIEASQVLRLESLEVARANMTLSMENARKIGNLRKLSTIRASCTGLLKGLYGAGIKLRSISVDDMSDALLSYLSFAKSILDTFEVRQSEDWYPRPSPRNPMHCPNFWASIYPAIKDSLLQLNLLACKDNKGKQMPSLMVEDVEPLLTCVPNPGIFITPSKSLKSLAVCIHPSKGFGQIFSNFLRGSPSLRSLELCMHGHNKEELGHLCYHSRKYEPGRRENEFKRMLSKTAPASSRLLIKLIGCDDDWELFSLFGPSWDWKTTYVWNGLKWRETQRTVQ